MAGDPLELLAHVQLGRLEIDPIPGEPENFAFRWATAAEVTDLADEAYAVRVLDALGGDQPAAVRHHDGVHLT